MKWLRAIFAFVVWAAAIWIVVPASAQSSYQVVTVSDGGTISGVVKWTGERPKPLTLPITKDAATCDPAHTGTRDLERLEIGADGGVANTVVSLRGIAQGKAWDLPDARKHLDQKECRYVPHISLVAVNTDLSIKSSDPILHTVHMVGVADYNLPFPMTDVTLTRTMHKSGVVDLKCNAGHIWMNGIVLVVNHPYYAVTDERGEFRISGVPPGEYEIVAWHEGWKVEREEPVLDVGTQTKTKRLFFTDPMTWQKKVNVSPNGHAVVDFQISEH
jgi:Polysaccharide lyase family 4, domain II